MSYSNKCWWIKLDIPFTIFCLLDLILNVQSTIFQLNKDRSSWVEPVLSWDKCVLLKDHNAVMPVRLEPAAPWSRVKHSTTEPLRSPFYNLVINLFTTMINLDIPCFENSVDPDQLASQKPADQDSHCFPLYLIHANNRNPEEESGT